VGKRCFLPGLLYGLVCFGSLASAHAQELPSLDAGNISESDNLPTLPSTPGTQVQRIGGDPEGMVFSSPVSTLPDIVVDYSFEATSSLDQRSNGLLMNAQGGGRSPSSLASSKWVTSGFGVPVSSADEPESVFISRPYLSSIGNHRSVRSQDVTAGGPGAGQASRQYPSGQYPSDMDPSDNFTGSLMDAGSITMQSDVPDLTASPEAFAQAFASAGLGDSSGKESSIQTPSFRLNDYGLTSHSASSLESREHRRQRGFTSLHDRLAAQHTRTTLKSRNADRIHSGLTQR
jgi:hypothetical protein